MPVQVQVPQGIMMALTLTRERMNGMQLLIYNKLYKGLATPSSSLSIPVFLWRVSFPTGE